MGSSCVVKREIVLLLFVGLAASVRVRSETDAAALPFVILHGIGDQCSNPGLSSLTKSLTKSAGVVGTCIEIGDGVSSSWLMPLYEQVKEVCRKVKALPHLQAGFNLVGFSQGNVIGRGYIEWCEGGPPVRNFVSVGGPHAGTAAVPLCYYYSICRLINDVIEIGIYSHFVQTHIAPTGYVKIPMDVRGYLSGCEFLPYLNNELPSHRNSTYKERFSAIDKLVLVMFELDSVIIPRESAWFGFYPEDDMRKVLKAQETDLYKEDWIGLRTLDEAGKVSYVSTPGAHMHVTRGLVEKYILPNIVPPGRRTSVGFFRKLVSFLEAKGDENEIVYSPPVKASL
eukprot:TRINITY_DN4212_c0_g1_i1.p1 TRINITY_DN4212_c0_g1~~TRINITY_DN4212_c0_g1_i1.p1  ORF type:complete len:340 (+),score=36.82 TRINITY_DN4212_c0_g1_i1:336-1355(+)